MSFNYEDYSLSAWHLQMRTSNSVSDALTDRIESLFEGIGMIAELLDQWLFILLFATLANILCHKLWERGGNR